jgi:hypothetical protein
MKDGGFMWTEENDREFKEHISKLSDDELIKIVCEDYEDYREEALQLAEAELALRGIEVEDEIEEGPDGSADESGNPMSGPPPLCPLCQGEMRSGVLFANKEVTIFFADRNEERFVEVLACSQCGQLRMVVDYYTDVES